MSHISHMTQFTVDRNAMSVSLRPATGAPALHRSNSHSFVPRECVAPSESLLCRLQRMQRVRRPVGRSRRSSVGLFAASPNSLRICVCVVARVFRLSRNNFKIIDSLMRKDRRSDRVRRALDRRHLLKSATSMREDIPAEDPMEKD